MGANWFLAAVCLIVLAIVVIGIACCRVAARYDADPMMHSQAPTPCAPMGGNLYEAQAWGAMMDDMQLKKGQLIADSMRADRAHAMEAHEQRADPWPEVVGVRLLLTKEQRERYGL